MVSEKQVAAVCFRVGVKTGAIQSFVQTLLKSLADAQLPVAGFINIALLHRLYVPRDFDDRFRLSNAAFAGERTGHVFGSHPPFNEQAVGVEAAMKSAGALVAVVVDIIPPHHAAEFDDVEISVARLQRVEGPGHKGDTG